MFLNLTKDNIKLFAAGQYSNPSCSTLAEFEEDYLRVKYLKMMLNKLVNNRETNMRIIVNHIICLSNVFPGEATAKILFSEFDPSMWNILCTFLVYLNLMPQTTMRINNNPVTLSKLGIDFNLLEKLKGF